MNACRAILILLTILISKPGFSADPQTYLIGQAGYMRLYQDGAADNNVFPTGMTFAGGVGFRKDYLEFEGLFMQGSLEGEINHDNAKNDIVHSQKSLILGANFYLNSRIYARFGYGFHKVQQQVSKDISQASEAGAIEEYGLNESVLTEGIVFGGGLVLISAKSIALFTQVERFDYSSIKASAWNASLGFRFYF